MAALFPDHDEFNAVRQFLEDRLEINISCVDGTAALHFASHLNLDTVIDEVLLVPEVEINIQDLNRNTPLILAAAEGNAKVVAKLLEHDDIRINECNTSGLTALMCAASNGHKEVVLQLLGYPFISLTAVDNKGRTAKMHAWENDHLEVCYILKECEKRNRTIALSSYLTAAVTAGDNTFVFKVLNASRNYPDPSIRVSDVINCEDEFGFTPLQIAVYLGNIDIVEKLVLHPAIDINKVVSASGCTALMLACERDQLEIVEKLLTHREIKIDQVDFNSKNALDYASSGGNQDIFSCLIRVSEYWRENQ